MPADYFLKLDPKVEGESTDSKHKGEIELESWSFGVSNNSSRSRAAVQGPASRCRWTSTSTKKTDKSSARLAQAVAMGDHFKSAILTVRKAGGTQQEYLTITLSDVFISSYQAGGSGSGTPADGAAVAELFQDSSGVQGAEAGRHRSAARSSSATTGRNKSRSRSIVSTPG